MNGGDSSPFCGSDTAVGYGLSSIYFPGRFLVSPPLHQTIWPGVDPRATMGVVTGVKRPNEEVSNQQTLGATEAGNTKASAAEEKVEEFRRLLGKSSGDVLKIVGVSSGAWGSVVASLLNDA
ncbi:hypothetical protein SUGI_1064700 [Cryptomeria japonica]|nr:hypothetical protein SUGI_1064700 [Cryptomeria japonica]